MVFDANTPIYLQIMDDFKKRMIKGEWDATAKIASVRELAVDYGVNPNTIQRALSELERVGLVYSERTSGRYVCKDVQRMMQLKEDYANDALDHCIQVLQELNYDKDAMLAKMEERLKHE